MKKGTGKKGQERGWGGGGCGRGCEWSYKPVFLRSKAHANVAVDHTYTPRGLSEQQNTVYCSDSSRYLHSDKSSTHPEAVTSLIYIIDYKMCTEQH